MRLSTLLLTLALVLASVHAATVGQNTKWYNQNANVTYVMPFDFNATSLGFNGNTFWIYNSTMAPTAYINLSFITPSYLILNLSDLTSSTSYGKATLYDSYNKNVALQPFTLYFNSSKDEGTLMPVWNASMITLNYTLGDKDWTEVNYSLNGGAPATLSSETAVVSQTQWDATQNITLWNGVAFNATDTYYLRKAHLYFTVAGTYNISILDSNLNILDSVIVTTTGGDTEIGGWQNVKFTSGNTYYLLANTSTDSNLAYMSSDVLVDACWANSTDLTSVTLDCTKDTYFKLIKLTYTNATLSPVDGYNNVTLTAKDSAGSTYSLTWGFINANKTIYAGLWNTIYANGAIEKERIFQNGSFDNYQNISDKVSVSVASGTVGFYDDNVTAAGFKLKQFSSQVVVNLSGAGQGNLTITPSATITWYNETRFQTEERYTFNISGTGTVNITRCGLGSLVTFRKYINGSYVTDVQADSVGCLSDTLSLSTEEVDYVAIKEQPPPSEGGGGGGGGGIVPPSTPLRWCAKEGRNIPESEWTEERCELEEVKELKVREARIVYFGHNEVKLPLAGFKVPLLEKQYCSLYWGKPARCRAVAVEAGKTVYVVGGVYSTYGTITPEGYRWWVVDAEGNEVLRYDGSPEFSTTFSMLGNYTLFLEIIDSEGNHYTANHSFEVVTTLPREEKGIEIPFPLPGKKEGNKTLADIVSEKFGSLANKTLEKLGGINLPSPESAGEAARGDFIYKVAAILVAIVAAYILFRG